MPRRPGQRLSTIELVQLSVRNQIERAVRLSAAGPDVIAAITLAVP